MFIFGLGNPGSKYDFTRHNFGFRAVDFFLQKIAKEKEVIKLSAKNYEHYKLRLYGKEVHFIKPLTFMNASGKAVLSLKTQWRFSNQEIMVIYDDKDLPLGQIKLKEKGSSGGHNGLHSIISSIGDNFPRLKLGISPQENGKVIIKRPLDKFVLSNFCLQEEEHLKELLPFIAEVIGAWIADGLEKCRQQYSGKRFDFSAKK